MLLCDVLEREFFPRKRNICNKSTAKHYRITVRHFGLMLGRPATTEDLEEDTAERFIVWCGSIRGLAAETVKQRRSYLVALWNWCAKRRLCHTWPTVQQVATPQQIPDAWTIDQLAALLAACRCVRGTYDGVPAREWWPSIHAWWFYEGERVSATLAARWADYRDGILIIQADARKGGKKPAVYNCHPIVRACQLGATGKERVLRHSPLADQRILHIAIAIACQFYQPIAIGVVGRIPQHDAAIERFD